VSPHEYPAALAGIREEAERLSNILDDLLMLARADGGERSAVRVPLFLDDLALDAVSAACALAPSCSAASRRGAAVPHRQENVQHHLLAGPQAATLQGPGDQRDGAVPAGGRVPGVMKEDHPQVGARVVWLADEAPVHIRSGRAAR